MTASKTVATMLTRLRRTITRAVFREHVFTLSLTLSLPPFFKLEIKAEPKIEKAAGNRRHRDA
jgi:hypothetical protein